MNDASLFTLGLLGGIVICLIVLLIVFYTDGGDPS